MYVGNDLAVVHGSEGLILPSVLEVGEARGSVAGTGRTRGRCCAGGGSSWVDFCAVSEPPDGGGGDLEGGVH